MATKDAETIKSLYEEALKLQNADKDDAALQRYAAIIDLNARIPEVHFQISRIFQKNDRLDRALRHIKAAATLKPGVHDIWKFWSELVMSLSDKGEQAAFRKALEGAQLEKRQKSELSTSVNFVGKSKINLGKLPAKNFEKIVSAIIASRFSEAETFARAELRRYPKVAALHDALAVALSGQERFEDALKVCERGIRLDPGYAEARANYGRVLTRLHRAPEAVHQCNVALRLTPGMLTALLCRAECYNELGRPDDAKADFNRAIAMDSKAVIAHFQLAKIHKDHNDHFEALAALKEARRLGADEIAVDVTEAEVLSDLDRPEDALRLFERALKKSPDNPEILSQIGELRQTLGDFDKATEAFETAMKVDPARGATFRVHLMTKKIPVDDPLVSSMETYFADESIAPERRANFGFALSKVMEDAKEYDRVFKYLHPANALMREAYTYDIDRRIEHEQRVIKSLRTVDWAKAEPNEKSEFSPIFVTGMPRSGTTLVEQIIASHSRVTGCGEVSVIPRETLKLFGDDEGRVGPARDVPQERYERLAEWYEKYMRARYPEADITTDKSIQSYAWVGPLKRAMPKCRFVIVRRDPRDNLLSMYKNMFPEGAHLYAYSLTNLTRIYQQFTDYVDLWRELTPDWFYEIQYEELVANPEQETRKLIDACGLEWEDGCLDFHKSDRRVKTLSLYQVRQPMYKSSTNAWERYGDELDELFEALGPDHVDAAE